MTWTVKVKMMMIIITTMVAMVTMVPMAAMVAIFKQTTMVWRWPWFVASWHERSAWWKKRGGRPSIPPYPSSIIYFHHILPSHTCIIMTMTITFHTSIYFHHHILPSYTSITYLHDHDNTSIYFHHHRNGHNLPLHIATVAFLFPFFCEFLQKDQVFQVLLKKGFKYIHYWF